MRTHPTPSLRAQLFADVQEDEQDATERMPVVTKSAIPRRGQLWSYLPIEERPTQKTRAIVCEEVSV